MHRASIDELNRGAWAEGLEQHKLVYPDERVVSFLAAHYSDVAANKDRKALDLGFGAGRHLRLLVDYGFQVAGIDYVETAADAARKIHGEGLAGCDLRQADLSDRPFPDHSFDVILCWGVLFLRPVSDIRKDLATLHALLKPGGRIVMNFRGTESWFYGRGTALDEHTFLLEESAGPYAGMCYSFFDRTEAKALLESAGFSVENSERIDLWKRDAQEHHAWWVFWIRKPTAEPNIENDQT